ncbi:MAG: hypothetical protein AAFV87_19450 [Pseudomonadota bacterium]
MDELTETFQLVDLAPLTAPLFDRTRSWQDRIDTVIAQLDAQNIECRVQRWGNPKYGLAALARETTAKGIEPPEALRALTALSLYIEMGGGEFVAPGDLAIRSMVEVQQAKGGAPEDYGLSPAAMDALMALYERAITVVGDANHFNGVIWDPVGIDAATAEAIGAPAPIEGVDGVFWYVAEEAMGWRHVTSLRDAQGALLDAEDAVLKALLAQGFHDLGDELGHTQCKTTLCFDSQIAGSLLVYSQNDEICAALTPYPLP